ncbi:hypothetical protein EZJ19_02450 [Parasulfuritortus cantonensis]|uniref:Uncharacterized protein n=1 Tax=Parasulfuritortus cantonensis TaxID=2528202 RepID=A0A4R1BLX1_9PROT|nr:hypothetical protein [Parasulfuritortus cantonensis]TCJ18389.1 hypothetical protein EZJ19_02450 [Parasulfuritortus cantonensis]
MANDAVMAIRAEAKKLARRYHALTGKPLGITGEVAEYEAARLLGVALTPARQAGCDALEDTGSGQRRLQIRGRRILPGGKPGQRIGAIDIGKAFDAVLLVLLNENFETVSIHEASRAAVITAITAPGSKARNERGALGVSQFKAIGRQRWPYERTP